VGPSLAKVSFNKSRKINLLEKSMGYKKMKKKLAACRRTSEFQEFSDRAAAVKIFNYK